LLAGGVKPIVKFGAVSIAVGVAVLLLKFQAARVSGSTALFSDALTTAGIVVALSGAALLHLPVIDPLIALAIGLNVATMGGATVLRWLSGLLDEAPPPALTARAQELVRRHAKGALEAHEICNRIEAALKREVEGAVIIIHVEPEAKAKIHGILVL
jgi:divalent metal cation (Fe/Co/Zn/Cd) transporter